MKRHTTRSTIIASLFCATAVSFSNTANAKALSPAIQMMFSAHPQSNPHQDKTAPSSQCIAQYKAAKGEANILVEGMSGAGTQADNIKDPQQYPLAPILKKEGLSAFAQQSDENIESLCNADPATTMETLGRINKKYDGKLLKLQIP